MDTTCSLIASRIPLMTIEAAAHRVRTKRARRVRQQLLEKAIALPADDPTIPSLLDQARSKKDADWYELVMNIGCALWEKTGLEWKTYRMNRKAVLTIGPKRFLLYIVDEYEGRLAFANRLLDEPSPVPEDAGHDWFLDKLFHKESWAHENDGTHCGKVSSHPNGLRRASESNRTRQG